MIAIVKESHIRRHKGGWGFQKVYNQFSCRPSSLHPVRKIKGG